MKKKQFKKIMKIVHIVRPLIKFKMRRQINFGNISHWSTSDIQCFGKNKTSIFKVKIKMLYYSVAEEVTLQHQNVLSIKSTQHIMTMC